MCALVRYEGTEHKMRVLVRYEGTEHKMRVLLFSTTLFEIFLIIRRT